MKDLVIVKQAKRTNNNVNCKLQVHNDLSKYIKKRIKTDITQDRLGKFENKLYPVFIEDFSESFSFNFKG